MIKNRIVILISLFFIIRLVGIMDGPLENGHNWRQTTGLMVSRNFLEINPSIFYPRVDDSNGKTGIIGMEFPFMNYLVFIMYKVFGLHDWFGRLLNLIVSSIGIYFFYKTIKEYFTEPIAFYSSILLLSSIWFQFSRKMMPDTFCISIMLIAVYFGLRFFYEKKSYLIFPFIILSSLAILCKIPAGIYLAVFSIPIFSKIVSKKLKIIFISACLIPLSLTYLWYFIQNPYLASIDQNWYNAGGGIREGMKTISQNLPQFFSRFYFNCFYSYTFFIVFLCGLYLCFREKNKKIIVLFFSVFLVFVIYILKSGFFFYHHNYYIIPIVPLFALIAAFGLSTIKNKKIIIFILIIGVSESILNQQSDFFQSGKNEYKLNLEPVLNNLSSKKDLIAVVGNGNPQELYLAHRKGWSIALNNIYNPFFLSYLRQNNCRFIVLNKEENSTFKGTDLKIVFKNEHYLIFSLK